MPAGAFSGVVDVTTGSRMWAAGSGASSRGEVFARLASAGGGIGLPQDHGAYHEP